MTTKDEKNVDTTKDEKKVDRRRFLKYAGVGAAGVAIAAAAAYIGTRPTTSPPVTNATSPPVTNAMNQTLTGMMTSSSALSPVDAAAAAMTAYMKTLAGTVNDDAKQASINWSQYSGTNLRMISLDEGTYDQLIGNDMAAQFKALTGISVSCEWYDGPQMLQKILTDFSTQTGTYDVVGIQSSGTMTQYIEKLNALAPLDDYLNNSKLTDLNWFDLDDFYPNLLEGTKYNGKTYSLADAWETTWTYYRKDIFDKYGVTKLPDTFDDLFQVAMQVNDPPTCYGIASRGLPSIDENIFTFCSFLFGYGSDYLGQDWKPMFNNDAGVASLEMYANLLQKAGPPGVASMGWSDERLLSMQGKAAINSPASYWRALPYWSKSLGECKVPGEMWFIPMQQGPAGYRVSPLFLHQHSLSNFSKNKEAAWLWLQFINSKLVSAYSEYPNLAWTRKSCFQIPVVSQMTSLMDSYDKYIPYASQTTYNYAFAVPIPEWPQVGQAVAIAVSAAIAGQQTPKAALDQAAVTVEGILDKAGYYKSGVAPYTHPPPPSNVTVQY